MSAWSPLARGLLARKPAADDAERLSPRLARALDIVTEIAAELGTTPAQVALAWVLQQGLMPVIGARTVPQIRDNLDAVRVRLDAPQLDRLDAATRVTAGYPHDILQRHSAALAPPG